MSNLRELRRRIKSVRNTAQITKAMQMVAATKMRKAQTQAIAGRPYVDTLAQSILTLLPNIDIKEHPLLHSNNASETIVILLSTDKSLCGALNTNVWRITQYFTDQRKPATFVTIGKKGRTFVVKTNRNLLADFDNPEVVNFKSARQVARLVTDQFLANKTKQVFLIFPHFISTLRQEPAVIKLLPIETQELEKQENRQAVKLQNSFLFEPTADVLLDQVLSHFIETQIYQGLLETKASEHSARMMAMQNATDNAKELVEDLKLTYNQTRQGAITAELLEITSATFALE